MLRESLNDFFPPVCKTFADCRLFLSNSFSDECVNIYRGYGKIYLTCEKVALISWDCKNKRKVLRLCRNLSDCNITTSCVFDCFYNSIRHAFYYISQALYLKEREVTCLNNRVVTVAPVPEGLGELAG